jgi:branched-chain amino acid aminotransferase
VHLGQFTADALREADEAFLTSTAGGIMPVNSVDGHILGGADGPGALTTKLHNLYWSKRWSGWLGTQVNYGK